MTITEILFSECKCITLRTGLSECRAMAGSEAMASTEHELIRGSGGGAPSGAPEAEPR